MNCLRFIGSVIPQCKIQNGTFSNLSSSNSDIRQTKSVMPVKTGIRVVGAGRITRYWIPAFAGMTRERYSSFVFFIECSFKNRCAEPALNQ